MLFTVFNSPRGGTLDSLTHLVSIPLQNADITDRWNLGLKKLLLSLILLASLPLVAVEDIDYPQNFYIEYQKLSQGSIFHVLHTDGTPFGKVIRTLDDKQELLFYVGDDKLVAKAELEKEGKTTTAIIELADGEELGWFCATIYTLYPDDFKLYSSTHCLIANGQMNWIGTFFRLTDPHNRHRELATFARPRFQLHCDSWHIEIVRDGIIDPAILVLIGAFQTSLNLGLEG